MRVGVFGYCDRHLKTGSLALSLPKTLMAMLSNSSSLASPLIKPFQNALSPDGYVQRLQETLHHTWQHFACLGSMATCKHATRGSWRFAHRELLSSSCSALHLPRLPPPFLPRCRLSDSLDTASIHPPTPLTPAVSPTPPSSNPFRFFPPLRINKHHRRNYHQRRDVSARSSERDKWCAGVRACARGNAHTQTHTLNMWAVLSELGDTQFIHMT